MRNLALALAALVLSAAIGTGCVVATTDGVVAVEEDFVYYPGHNVYYSSAHDHWYVQDSGNWVVVNSRPSTISLSANVDVVNVRGERGHPWKHR